MTDEDAEEHDHDLDYPWTLYLTDNRCRDGQKEVSSHLCGLRRSLLEIVAADHLPKDIRRFIHELPTKL